MKHVTKRIERRGFSLIEVVIAIGIVAILLTTFLAVFAPAQKNIQRSLSVKDANRLVSTLENEMGILRKGQEDDYSSAFDKAYEWIKGSDTKDTAVLVYQYNAYPGNTESELNPDETPRAYDVAEENGIPGRDFVTHTVVRSLGDSDSAALIQEELQPGVVEGPVYVVRMTQLVPDSASGGLEVGTPGQIVDPSASGSVVADSEDYPGAAIAFQAEFFRLRSNLESYVTGNGWDFGTNLGEPVSTTNIAVRR